MGSTYQDLRALPDAVKRSFGFALDQAQRGGKSPDAKPLQGFGHAGVLEIVENTGGNTYRGVYTVRYEGIVYVLLHVFQKKAKRGISTPRHDIELVKRRLKLAEADYITLRQR